MKKIKFKIKRFLAYWLKDELLEFIGYNPTLPDRTFMVQQYGFETAKIEAVIKLPVDPYEYENLIHNAKAELFKAAEPYFNIRTQELTHSEFAFARKIHIELFLGKKQ